MDCEMKNPKSGRSGSPKRDLITVNEKDSPSWFEYEVAGLFLDFFMGLFNSILYKRTNKQESEFFKSKKIFNLELAVCLLNTTSTTKISMSFSII